MKNWIIGCVVLIACGAPGEEAPSAREQAVQRSIQDLRVLSPEWVCAVVDPTEEILAERDARYGEVLQAEKARYDAGQLAWWYWPFAKQFRMLNIQKDYHQPLFVAMNQPAFWTVNDRPAAEVTVWPHSIDGFPNWDADDAPATDCGNYSRVANMVYLKLSRPLHNGDALTVRAEDGRVATTVFDERRTPCWSIKVNQVSYAAGAQEKHAYLGMWLPGIGPVDYSAFAGQPFHVHRFAAGDRWDAGQAVGEPLFTGEIRLRMRHADQEITREGGSNASGEDVYELDFSALSDEGTYCILIPGLGRSWPFRISRSGYADAFYTMMKGLYIQRCGCALTEPHTAWTRPECHTVTRQGTYIPETEGWYRNAYRQNEPAFGFRDADGARIRLSPFTLIGNEEPDAPIMADVKGGWHDAADFDRRIFHYTVVHDLLALYEFFPGRFRDQQLNLPESGNGIPDVLDEAAYGVDVWRLAQREDGAVCSWIEQESHPGKFANDLTAAFATNQMPMYASIPDRGGSYAYAAAAAWLGRLLQPYDPERGAAYIASARRAYAWAHDASHAMSGSFTITKPMRNANLQGQTIQFDEDPELRLRDRTHTAMAFAAAYLFIATGDEAYRDHLRESAFGDEFPSLADAINPAQCLPLLAFPALTEEEQAAMRRTLIELADRSVASQQEYAYRLLWRSPSDGWFHAMAWGNLYTRTRSVVAAYALTGDAKYRNALEHAANFFLGCNPLGQSMVTGLGSVFPVVIQHIHSQSDGIAEPTPGIAPYSFTFGFSTRPFMLLDGGHPSVREYFSEIAVAFIPDRLGRAAIQAGIDEFEREGNWTHEATIEGRDILWRNFPVFRRKVTHPGAAVDQNEFTVGETISPLALLFGALTPAEWSVSEGIRNRQPRRTIDQLPYYSMP
jgi:endoglucanase